MARYTETKIFERNPNSGANLLIIQANSGTVAVEYEMSNGDWIVADTYNVDAVLEFNRNRTRVRVSVAGGAVYEIA